MYCSYSPRSSTGSESTKATTPSPTSKSTPSQSVSTRPTMHYFIIRALKGALVESACLLETIIFSKVLVWPWWITFIKSSYDPLVYFLSLNLSGWPLWCFGIRWPRLWHGRMNYVRYETNSLEECSAIYIHQISPVVDNHMM